MRYWKPQDIFTVACPHCRAEIEFWKDEPFRLCPTCRKEVRNPKTDMGCAERAQTPQLAEAAVPARPTPPQLAAPIPQPAQAAGAAADVDPASAAATATTPSCAGPCPTPSPISPVTPS